MNLIINTVISVSDFIFGILILIGAILFIMFVCEVIGALMAGKCPKCGSRRTGVERSSSHDNHRLGGAYETTHCRCRKCRHTWNAGETKFVSDDDQKIRDVFH